MLRTVLYWSIGGDTMFYLVRHGKTDYSEKNTGIYQGFGVNLAPLSKKGIEDAKKAVSGIRLKTGGVTEYLI